MALKNFKPNKSKKNGKFKGYEEEGFPKMKTPTKGIKEKFSKNKWQDYLVNNEEDDE
ncbi:hypothetical protein [Thermoflexibacter ruber]|uniref:Uncharacterized protein n=1 Tax=Thermoflexibacter ruber TaxID=1003 RepID=A0A1I2IF88_9BACT|nr:hypothetical protein [Thermoflexibacter ruber]SFF40308.1 hypothetical protein SAMN04488541_103131 [Thermoflexibacter ruber]